jgi:hypothetical protein
MSNYIEVTPSDIFGMKYALLTSVDIEYSFNRYEFTMKSNRRTLKFENF